MNRPRLIAFCVFLTFIMGAGFVFSQELNDAHSEFIQGYNDEFRLNENGREYYDFYGQIYGDMVKTESERIRKRLAALGRDTDIEDYERIRTDILIDDKYAIQKPLSDKAKELFPDAQRMQQRLFQMNESIMRRLESLSDIEDLTLASLRIQGPYIFAPLPDFLELTPEQIELMKEQQKEATLKLTLLHVKSNSEQPEKVKEYAELMEQQWELMRTQGDWSASEEWNEIQQKVRKNQMDRMKGILPQWKAILIESRENYMRVLTDSQKAKIAAVMAEMPDYMKNLFAAIDRQGGGLSILNNWQPGMGVPDVPNPNREAPRQHSSTGGRAFPEN